MPTASRVALLAAALLATGCELTEVSTAVPDDIVVAEVVLHGGQSRQTAYLHRTLSARGDARVFEAAIRITGEGGEQIVMFAVEDSVCLTPAPDGPRAEFGTCYATPRASPVVRPGARYDLQIVLADGRRLTGSTRVPADFDITVPARATCSLTAGRSLQLGWTRSAGTSVYIGEARLTGLQAALRSVGVPLSGAAPINLLALAIGAADTTMTFPADFGVFDRFDTELHDALVAIRDGLPGGVRADVAIAAADLNYVNWVRGGTFNPSGTVRIPSVHGGGTGVFGAVVVRQRTLHTGVFEDEACGD
jgi:hypothetical protein